MNNLFANIYNMNFLEFLKSVTLSFIIIYIACEFLDFCICFLTKANSKTENLNVNRNTRGFGPPTGKIHFNIPVPRVSRLGTITYNHPFSTNLRT